MTIKQAFLRVFAKIMVFCVAMTGVFYTANATNLPTGYTELEYIESTGTQWIDTGLKPNSNWRIVTSMRFSSFATSSSRVTHVIGARDAAVVGGGYGIRVLDGIVYSDFFGNRVQMQTADIGTWYNVDKNKNVCTFGDTTVTNTATTASVENNNCCLFGFGLEASFDKAYPGTMAQKTTSIYDDNVLVRNLIPARRESDGVLGMYDTVSGQFYTNAGTGTFIAGPAKCRNLFDGQWQQGLYSTSTGGYAPNVSNRICNVNMIQIKPSTTYTVSCPDYALAGGMRWVFYDENKNFISAIANGVTTVTTPSNAKYINFYIANDLTVATAPDLQLEQGSTATAYSPYCSLPIKIATTAYNNNAFSSVQTALNTAVTAIKDVVSNTIAQAAAVQSLQTAKQTMPDASDTDGTCPRFRQCLLIQDPTGKPHWYQIKDPVRDLVLSLKNNKVNNSGQTTSNTFAANGYDGTNNTTDSRYYKGYSAMRLKTSAQSSSVYTRQFSAAGLSGNQYKTLGDQEWAVTWDGNETGTADSFLPGVIYGTSRCAKTKPSSTAPGTTGWTTIENSEPLNDLENVESYVHCYCKITGVGLDGMITPVRDSSQAPWVFSSPYGSAGNCASGCALDCVNRVRDYASFRQSLMGWAVK